MESDKKQTPDELAPPTNERRRNFLKGAAAIGGAAAAVSTLGFPHIASAQQGELVPSKIPMPGKISEPGKANHWYIPASDKTVHWGYFSKHLKPIVEIESGDFVTIECVTHQAGDDFERLGQGDPGIESIYYWTKTQKNVNRRGAGPMDAPNGAGGGQGVHVMTGPIAVRGAEPGDIVEVRILDMYPRPCANPKYKGKSFGTNIAAWWGYQYHDMLTGPKPRETVTIFEYDDRGDNYYARAVHSYRWKPVTDPFGVVHKIYDYPGLIADLGNPPAGWGRNKVDLNTNVLRNVRIPLRPHFGNLALTPREADIVNSIPPDYIGGNIDDWRITKGASMFYPVSVDGALISAGDTHAAMGDSELDGTAIESSWTGVWQVILHKQNKLGMLGEVKWPLLETRDEWVVHGFSYPNYLIDLGPNAQSEVFKKAETGPDLTLQDMLKTTSIDLAMRDAWRKMRQFLMTAHKLSEDEAIAVISLAVDFGITQVVDGNFGVHATLKKDVFVGEAV